MGTISVHEFITLDGVIENPKWSFGFPFDPKMGAAIRAIMGGCSAMLADGLVDDLHLFVYPIALGHGDRLFQAGQAETRLALRGCESYTSGVVHLAYGPAPS